MFEESLEFLALFLGDIDAKLHAITCVAREAKGKPGRKSNKAKAEALEAKLNGGGMYCE